MVVTADWTKGTMLDSGIGRGTHCCLFPRVETPFAKNRSSLVSDPIAASASSFSGTHVDPGRLGRPYKKNREDGPLPLPPVPRQRRQTVHPFAETKRPSARGAKSSTSETPGHLSTDARSVVGASHL